MVWQLSESPDVPKYDTSSLEGFFYGGAASAKELPLRFNSVFRKALPGQGYGMVGCLIDRFRCCFLWSMVRANLYNPRTPFPSLPPSPTKPPLPPQTETSSVAVMNAAEDYLRKPTSVGVGIPTNDVMLEDPDTGERFTTPGRKGEVIIRGPNIIVGYYRNEEATKGAISEDGFMHTWV